MNPVTEPRRNFFCRIGVLFLPLNIAVLALRAQQPIQDPHAHVNPKENGDDPPPIPAGTRDALLKENEKDIKKKVDKLFQLATELKNEVDKTDSAKVLSLAMLKKADEIEKLAKDIKSRAKG